MPPANAQQVEKCANSFLQCSHTDRQSAPLKIGQNWAYCFVERLPDEYKLPKQKHIDPKRVNAEDIGVVEEWYDYLDAAVRRHQTQPGDIYNFDETGFLEGQVVQRRWSHSSLREMIILLPHFCGV